MTDSVRPHRRQPTKLLCPWDSPGKNTGVGCHFPLQCMKVKSESEVAQSCPTLSDPMDWSLPGSSVHGISRQEHWSGVPLPSAHGVTKSWTLLSNWTELITFIGEKNMSGAHSMVWQDVLVVLSYFGPNSLMGGNHLDTDEAWVNET